MAHGNNLPLPHDAVYEILVRVPGKDLCRLRAVCRPRRRLLSDPHFIAVGYHAYSRDDGVVCDVVDLSAGSVVQRVHARDGEWAASAELGLVCTSTSIAKSFRLRSLATGDVLRALPEGLSEENALRHGNICEFDVAAVVGQAASSGEYKVFRVLGLGRLCPRFPFDLETEDLRQLCEVFTLDDSTQHARWRGKQESPPETVSLLPWRSVVINGIAYFLSDEFIEGPDATSHSHRVVPFDLETEEWIATLLGPPSNHAQVPCTTVKISISAMNGFLAMATLLNSSTNMDLWFLVDFERGLWVKQHSIQLHPLRTSDDDHRYDMYPLMVLGDGRIVLAYVGHSDASLRIYNPRSGTFMDEVAGLLGRCSALSVYESPLSLANSATRCGSL